jgi:hypothetical protein
MNHVITLGGLLKFFGVIAILVGLAFGALWAFAKGMSDQP